MAILLIILTITGLAAAQNRSCIFYQQAVPGRTYKIESPGYPNSYPQNIECKWIIECNSTYNCRLDCPVIQLPQDCSDKLKISRNGDYYLNGAYTYCGSGSTVVTSEKNVISLGLQTSRYSQGGRFSCTLSSVKVTPTPTCTCGVRNGNRILGGNETGFNEYPMMVALIDSAEAFCGGDIISKRYVLTAAHCVYTKTPSGNYVYVGAHNLAVDESPIARYYYINQFTVHPQFDSRSYNYDVAIVKTDTDIQFSNYVIPACLPFKYGSVDFAGKQLIALGWGTTGPGAPTSDTLQQVKLNVLTNYQCINQGGNPTNNQFCTYTQGKDTCQMDSGGPLLYSSPDNGLLYAIGIISNSRSLCGDRYPGINTKISAILSWIENNTPDAKYCRV